MSRVIPKPPKKWEWVRQRLRPWERGLILDVPQIRRRCCLSHMVDLWPKELVVFQCADVALAMFQVVVVRIAVGGWKSGQEGRTARAF